MAILPSQFAIDYQAILVAATENGPSVASYLRAHLPAVWRDVYVRTADHQTNLVHLQVGDFDYICDLYSQLEMIGEVPIDQTVQDRVVAVFGSSAPADNDQAANRKRTWVAVTEELPLSERDAGHFIARCFGGGNHVNIFSQDRGLNRGWSPQGRVYRHMEKYCADQPGTFCFSRPIYTEGTGVPRWLEFGVLKTDETLWVEAFDN